MTIAIYAMIGVLVAAYTLMHMATQDWFQPSLKEYWLHYVLMLASIMFVWPVWMVMGFITYVMEVVPRKRG